MYIYIYIYIYIYVCIYINSKVNESRYITLFVVSGSFKKRFLIDCVNIYFSQSIVYTNIYLFSIFFSIDFPQWKSVGLPTLLTL